MATKKTEDADVTVTDAGEIVLPSGTGVVDTSGWVEAPNNSARPADHPVGNTTFADRAKARGGNKRVAESESK